MRTCTCVTFWRVKTGAGKYIFRVTRPNGECSQNLVSNPADIADTTARIQKLVYHTHTEPTRDRIPHTKHENTNLISMLLQ